MIFGKTVVWENILKFRTFNHVIRTWVERKAEGPGHEEDQATMQEWVYANRQKLDAMPAEEVCKAMSEQFRRISAIEVLNGYANQGCLLYPRWP
jgi:hypothetical protein